jgi:hypothetical protein
MRAIAVSVEDTLVESQRQHADFLGRSLRIRHCQSGLRIDNPPSSSGPVLPDHSKTIDVPRVRASCRCTEIARRDIRWLKNFLLTIVSVATRDFAGVV